MDIRTYDVQEIELQRRNIRFQLAAYVKPDGTTVVGELPPGFQSGHFCPQISELYSVLTLSMSGAATVNL